MSEQLFKWTKSGGRGVFAQRFRWDLPKDGEPGTWMPKIRRSLEACVVGYHLCRQKDLVPWANDELWIAEYRGKRIDADDKIVVQEARLVQRVDAWNETTARMFAADCAEQALHFFEDAVPGDTRPRETIAAARAFARGEITRDQLFAAESAATSAAWFAARPAAWFAAESAATSAARFAARPAATSAARSAAGSAARPAARPAATSAARQWQSQRLLEILGISVEAQS